MKKDSILREYDVYGINGSHYIVKANKIIYCDDDMITFLRRTNEEEVEIVALVPLLNVAVVRETFDSMIKTAKAQELINKT